VRTCLMLAGFLLMEPGEGAEVNRSPEYRVKAAYLYNFVQFVDWPAEVFPGQDSPFVIGVLGTDPFGAYLDELVRNVKVNGHAFMVARYRGVDQIDHCHVLFVSDSEAERAAQIVASLRGRSILTVCDGEIFAREGAIVRFVTRRNRVQLQINLDAAKQVDLTISSKLLRSAEIISPGKD